MNIHLFLFQEENLIQVLDGFIPSQLFTNDKIGFQSYLWGIICDIDQMTFFMCSLAPLLSWSGNVDQTLLRRKHQKQKVGF